MHQEIQQTQTTTQVQQLSTLQVAVANLVALPITELATRVRDEMLDNAALEEKDDSDFPEDNLHEDNGNENNDKAPTDDDFDNDNAAEELPNDTTDYGNDTEDYGREADAVGDYLTADDIPDYLNRRVDDEREKNEGWIADQNSFYEELQAQIGEHDLSEEEAKLMDYLIGSLDEDGFLRKDLEALADELAIYHNVDTTSEELLRLLKILQTFEPRGIGARSLQECLHIQLLDPDRRTPYTPMALKVVDQYFKDFVNHRWDFLMAKLKTDAETFAHVRHELTHLNPRPGRALSETGTAAAPVVVPDFFLRVTSDGTVAVTLNQGDVPELRISRSFRDTLRQYGQNRPNLTRQQRDAYTYARQKVDAASSFINLLSRRRNTLLAVMEAIVHFQNAFFLGDDDEELLVPLTLKQIAERTGFNISTVSRVTSNKYVQTAYGTYLLKFFFSTQFTSSEGDELSTRRVQAALASLIEAEDKTHPLTDDLLAAQLKAQGFNVARRTVAKYRDVLGIPTTRLRKR